MIIGSDENLVKLSSNIHKKLTCPDYAEHEQFYIGHNWEFYLI